MLLRSLPRVRRQRSSVPCEVLEVDGARVRVATQSPCRELEVWVEDCWIDGVLTREERLMASSSS